MHAADFAFFIRKSEKVFLEYFNCGICCVFFIGEIFGVHGVSGQKIDLFYLNFIFIGIIFYM